jgi:hypothetical protein
MEMQGLMKRAVMAVLGVAVVLGWWSLRGWFEGKAAAESYSHIPTQVWEGGGGKVTIVAESSEPGKVSASFETNNPVDDKNHKFLEAWEKIGAGRHTFTLDVPPNVGGTVEVDVEDPKVGSKVRVEVEVNGQVVAADSATLDAPLKPGYAFFAQVELDDYATGKQSED